MNKIIAIVPAAGIGKRMSLSIPKQYLIIKKRTVIEHSINVLLKHKKIKKIIVIINKNDFFFSKLSISKKSDIIVVTINKSKNRCQSVFLGVKKAIELFGKNFWIIIHDAVRPCLKIQDISKIISSINEIGSVLAYPMYNTVKYSSNNFTINYSIQRNFLWNALTPQLFPAYLLFKCLKTIINNNIPITDESSALEHCGYSPKIVIGKSSNIKITYLEDLYLANFYLNEF